VERVHRRACATAYSSPQQLLLLLLLLLQCLLTCGSGLCVCVSESLTLYNLQGGNRQTECDLQPLNHRGKTEEAH